MTAAARLLTFLTAQRGFELMFAKRNTRALVSRGAYECGAGHYPVMVTLHGAWLAMLWLSGRKRTIDRRYAAAFATLQMARLWALLTLGDRWTTRIIVLPGAERIARGPYRWLRHPNYAVVALELPCVSLALGLRANAAVFGALNLAMLAWRIRAEDHAYAEAQSACDAGDMRPLPSLRRQRSNSCANGRATNAPNA